MRRNALEISALEEELAAEEAALTARLPPPPADEAAVGEGAGGGAGVGAEGEAAGGLAEGHKPAGKQAKKKPKKGKKGKPPPEVIAFLRGKRERVRALKAAHATQLGEAVAALSELELDAIEEMGLPTS